MSDKEDKIPLSVVKKLPYKTLNRMINKARKYLKTNDVWQSACKEYGESADIIDYIPVMFGNLDVSAKTDKGVIILSYKLLCDANFIKDYSYLIHEGIHYLQQTCGKKATKSSDDGDYLKNPFEQEAFIGQVQYIADHEGKNEAEEYVEDLLEHHDKDGKEKDKLEEVLMSKV